MYQNIMNRVKSSFLSIAPIFVIVYILHFTGLARLSDETFDLFTIASLVLVLGSSLFSIGADLAMQPMGEFTASSLVKSQKIWLIVLVTFALGALITIAEPDLSVLATQAPISGTTVKLTIALGVGAFLVIGVLKVIFNWRLKVLLWIFYALVLILAFFASPSLLPISFDSGGVTTGPITVPFLMAFGVGIASIRPSKENSFGFVSLCSVGPILAMLVLSLFTKADPTYTYEVVTAEPSRIMTFIQGSVSYIGTVAASLLPIFIFFVVFEALFIRLPKKKLLEICMGTLYTFIGLMLFLTAIYVGFLPAGLAIGKALGSQPALFIVVAFVIGIVVVLAEPSVQVLVKQVEAASGRSISHKALYLSLSLGVGAAIALSAVRILCGFSILWLVVPGYVIALLLSLVTPSPYTAIAFDAGGVASGPVTSGFILPFMIGATITILGEGSIVVAAFGVIALVALAPLISLQLLGLSMKLREEKKHRRMTSRQVAAENELIEFPEVTA